MPAVRIATLLSLMLAVIAPELVQAQQLERENVRISGVLADLGPGILQVTDKAGQTWLVKLEEDRTEVSFTATATPDWIRPGMWLQLRTSLNQRLQGEAPVSEITVFTPKADQQLGIVPEATLGQGLFSGEQQELKVDKDKPVPCVVRGRLVGIKKNKITINAGQAVTVDVPDDVKVMVEVADYRLAKPGDKVEIAGWKYAMVPGRAVAQQLSIAAEEPLTGARPKPRRPSKDSDANETDTKPANDSPSQEGADRS